MWSAIFSTATLFGDPVASLTKTALKNFKTEQLELLLTANLMQGAEKYSAGHNSDEIEKQSEHGRRKNLKTSSLHYC